METNREDTSLPTARRTDPQVWNFESEPGLHPMKVTVNADRPGTAPGFLFVAPYTAYGAEMIGQTGALMMDRCGNPVWFRPLENRYLQNTDFRVQRFHGHPVLTMWQGTISGTQSGEPNLPDGDPEPGAFFLALDQQYVPIFRMEAQEGFTADVHEFTITRRNTALFTAVRQEKADLRPYGGPQDGWIDNYSIQEVDPATGRLLFFWSAFGHVDPANSMLPASSAAGSNNIWDCYHVNSVEEGPRGTLLVSMRNMWAIYLIDRKTGDILWQLGGKRSDFGFGPCAAFSWQHDARFRDDWRISLFDDACCASSTSPPDNVARGLILRLDYRAMSAQVDRTFYHDPPLFVASQGNVQQLPGGSQLVGWGQQSYLSEFRSQGNTKRDPAQNLLYDMEYPNQNITYRAFKDGWVGMPLDPPSIAVEAAEGGAAVYASWNGATQAVAWQVLAGTAGELASVAICPRRGFETRIAVKSEGPSFVVNALDSGGRIIGQSKAAELTRS